MIEKMQSMLDRLVAWGTTCGLRFNPQKTVAVLFSRATKPCTRPVRMDGQLVPLSDSVVYLGVTMDRELKWQVHITNKVKKAKQLIMKLANITHSYWGPRPKLLRWAFTGIVRPMVSYAAMVWAHQTENENAIDRLCNLTRTAINTIVKVPRSTPTQGLELILDILPLHLHVRQEGVSAYARLQPNLLAWEGVFTNLTNSVSHLRYWSYMAQDAHLQDFHTETDTCNVLRPTARFHLDTTSFVDMESCQEPLDCNVYTDGSKINDRVGAGVFIVRAGTPIISDKFRLPDTSTVYQAELAAIKEAAALLNVMTDLTTVKFYVDSQAALRTLQSDFITSKLALQTYHLHNTIPAQHVVLVWTKAHVGTEGNEQADKLAKEGTTLNSPLAIPAPRASIKASIKQLLHASWDREWTLYPKARQTKLYHPHYDKQKSNELIQWPRLKLGRYIRAVTGHSNLLYHLHTMQSSISPICRFCLQANEEFHHLATDCPPFWWERHLISATDPSHVHNWTIHQIIAFAYLPSINQAFIKPLYQLDRPPPTATQLQDNPDDPEPYDSDMAQDTDSSLMNITSETASSSQDDEHINIDDDSS